MRPSSRALLTELVLPYTPTEKQLRFHNSTAKYRLYGGAAGGGKSHALLWENINQCVYIPKWTALILRRTFPELEASQIQKFRMNTPAELYTWNEQKKIATFVNGSVLRFSFCEHETDVLKFQSDEYGSISFDELTHFSLSQWTYLTSRNRSTTGFRPNMTGGTNPGGPGMTWVKALWIEKRPAPGMEDYQYDPKLYDFIPALVYDNPHLIDNDPEYVEQLKRLPPILRKALLEGSWDILAGQFFDRFSLTENVVEDPKIPSYWRRYIATDWGYDHPAATLWFATDGKQTIVYREHVVRKRQPDELAREILEKNAGDKIDSWYLSHDAFARKTSERTLADEMTIPGLPPPQRADRTSASSWGVLHGMFADRELTISSLCPDLITTIPHAIRDYPDDPENILDFDGNDALDALSYGAVTHRRIAKVPNELIIAEKLSKAENPHHMSMLARQLEAKAAPKMVGFRRAWRMPQ